MLAILKINKIIKNKNKALNDIKRIQFLRLYRQTQKAKNDENARIIQQFIKEKLRRHFDKRELVKKGVDAFNIFLKRKILKNIQDNAKEKFTKTIIKKTIIRQENANNKILKDAFDKWRNLVPVLIQNEAADKIISLLRTNLAKNKLKNLRLRMIRLINIHKKYEDKNQKKLFSYFHEWLRRVNLIKNNENARIIQNFCRVRMEEHNEE